LYTSSTVRIAVQSGGGVRLGTSTAAVDPGDLSAGDGTNDLFWNSSATQLQITGYSVSSSRGVLQTGTVNGLIGSTVENLSTGASGQGRTDVICGTALGALQAFSQNHSLTYKAGAVVITNSNSTNGIFIEENGDDAIYFNESAITRMRLGTNTAAGPGGLTIGDVAGAAATAATGDIVATDGTNELFWNASAASVDFLTSSTIRANGGALDLTLGARGATYALNDGANTTLNTTNQTIIGALNELDTAVTAADPNEVLLATVASIDAKSATTTNLYTATATTIITKVILLCTAADTITAVAAAGVGIAAGEDDIFGSEPLTGLDVADKAFTYLAAGTRVVATNTDIVKLGIDTAATGTSQTFTAYVFGYEA
jgi:hypothetical protein